MPFGYPQIFTYTGEILSHPTWDLIFLFLLIAIGFFYGLWAGKRMIISTIIYTYVALALVPILPVEILARALQFKDIFFLKIGIFLTAFMLLVALLGRGGARAFSARTSWWQVFLLSFVQAGLLIHIMLGFLSPEKAKLLAPLTRNFFANPDLRLWWLLGPLVILIFICWFEWKEKKKW